MKKITFLLFSTIFTSCLFAQKKELTLEDAILYQGQKLHPKTIHNIQFIPNENAVSYPDSINKVLFKKAYSGKLDTLLKISDLRPENEGNYISSFNKYQWVDKNTLFIKGKNSGYFYDFSTKKLTQAFGYFERVFSEDIHFSSGQLAFTRKNNLYITKGTTEVVVAENENENIIAGQSISRNEFGISKGTFWSPNGNMLAFYQKDETQVNDYPLLYFTSDKPGRLENIKYPMAGQPSEVVSVGVFHTLTSKVVYLKTTKDEFDYMTNLAWDPSENFVYVAELNRGQNHVKLNKYSAITGDFVATLFEEKSETWIEPEHAPYFFAGTKRQILFG